jgi:hypothetical protein
VADPRMVVRRRCSRLAAADCRPGEP